MILQNPLMVLLALLSLPLIVRAYRTEELQWKIVGVLNIATVILLSLAAASPAVQTQVDTVSDKEVVYLTDNSNSMLNTSEQIDIEGVSVQEKIIGSGNSSNLESSLINSVRRNQTYLVKSDMRGIDDPQRIIDVYENHNSSIYFVKPKLPEETSISLKGPSTTVPGAENSFTATVSSTDNLQKEVTVFIDGEEVASKEVREDLTVNQEFTDKGYHRIEARVKSDDRHSSNNRYYKSVRVVEKPELLIVGESGGLQEELSEFYDITTETSLPEDMSRYHSVLLKKKPVSSEQLKPYLTQGNGLVYTGDGSMDVLPVKTVEADQNTNNPAMIVALDISKAKSGINKIDIDTSRSFAFNLVKNLGNQYPGTKLGLAAYTDFHSTVSTSSPLGAKSDRLSSKITRLKLISGQEYHQLAIHRSIENLNGSGNILLVTDGEIPSDRGVYSWSYRSNQNNQVRTGIEEDLYPDGYNIGKSFSYGSSINYKQRVIQYINDRLDEDIQLFTVAVGDDENKNTEFLKEMADHGGGKAYDTVEEFYQNPPQDIGGGGYGGESYATETAVPHPITSSAEGVDLAATKIDDVEVKPTGKALVETSSERPVLSTWRYGLGRVAAYSAGDSDLGSFLNQAPRLVSNSISWTAGSPLRKDNKSLEVDSARYPDKVEVSSDRKLDSLTRKAGGTYETEVKPESLGFHKYRNRHVYTYNYDSELENLGYRDGIIEDLAQQTGGRVLKAQDLNSIKPEITSSTSKTVDYRSFTPYLLIVALILFLGQVGYRKRRGLI
jgi:hypothetical protein